MAMRCSYGQARRDSAIVCGSLLLMILPATLGAQVDCGVPGNNTPAVPVPQCVTAQGLAVACTSPGAVELWPPDFRPASGIPPNRDSTAWFEGIGIPRRQAAGSSSNRSTS